MSSGRFHGWERSILKWSKVFWNCPTRQPTGPVRDCARVEYRKCCYFKRATSVKLTTKYPTSGGAANFKQKSDFVDWKTFALVRSVENSIPPCTVSATRHDKTNRKKQKKKKTQIHFTILRNVMRRNRFTDLVKKGAGERRRNYKTLSISKTRALRCKTV